LAAFVYFYNYEEETRTKAANAISLEHAAFIIV
jgi:hypothetical protein